MNLYEREYFVSRIRVGYYVVKDKGLRFKVHTPSLEDEFESSELFTEAFDSALLDGVMTEQEMDSWMLKTELWSSDKDDEVKNLEKQIENHKVDVFQNRSKERERERSRLSLRSTEFKLSNLNRKKTSYYDHTCEGLASLEKQLFLFRRSCFLDGKPVDFESQELDEVQLYYQWMHQVLKEGQVREIVRTDPWRSLWALKEESTLFKNKDRELTMDQKHALIWSRMYDNVQESMDCPPEEVINDDDMLDGWFIVQRRKQESEKATSELENKTQNPKISASEEVFVMADSAKEAENINSMNSIQAQMTKRERMAVIQGRGTAEDKDFRDQQLKIVSMSNEQFKGRGR